MQQLIYAIVVVVVTPSISILLFLKAFLEPKLCWWFLGSCNNTRTMSSWQVSEVLTYFYFSSLFVVEYITDLGQSGAVHMGLYVWTTDNDSSSSSFVGLKRSVMA